MPKDDKEPPAYEMNGRYASRDCAAVAAYDQLALDKKSELAMTEFGGWVAIVGKDGDGKPLFAYTNWTSIGSGGGPLAAPAHVVVKAYCHSHPDHYHTQAFSYEDLQSFKDMATRGHGMAFYLRTPLGQLVKAELDTDFPGGKDVAIDACRRSNADLHR
jgi:hypothetical protein